MPLRARCHRQSSKTEVVHFDIQQTILFIPTRTIAYMPVGARRRAQSQPNQLRDATLETQMSPLY